MHKVHIINADYKLNVWIFGSLCLGQYFIPERQFLCQCFKFSTTKFIAECDAHLGESWCFTMTKNLFNAEEKFSGGA